MEVACTLVCPKDNHEVIITHPDGSETQKCEKCEVDCPKGEFPVSDWPAGVQQPIISLSGSSHMLIKITLWKCQRWL